MKVGSHAGESFVLMADAITYVRILGDSMAPGGKMAVAPCVVSTSRRTVERGWRLKGVALYYYTYSSMMFLCYDSYVCPHRLGDYTHTQSFRCSSIILGAQLLFIKPAYANYGSNMIMSVSFDLYLSTGLKSPNYRHPLKQTRNPKLGGF